jgi:hypothetical protein
VGKKPEARCSTDGSEACAGRADRVSVPKKRDALPAVALGQGQIGVLGTPKQITAAIFAGNASPW